ncbi:MAG: hypothetical protein U0X20_32355 [Caldilineaceae bacterium]
MLPQRKTRTAKVTMVITLFAAALCLFVAGTTMVSAAESVNAPAPAAHQALAKASPPTKPMTIKGSWDSSETPTFVPAPPPDATIMFVDGHASGNADQLGKYTATFKATVNASCGCSQGDSIQFIAANGDSLYGLGQGIGVPDKPGFARVTQTYAIMGGTGRFVGATGNIVVIRLANTATGVSSGSFEGSIVIPSRGG